MVIHMNHLGELVPNRWEFSSDADPRSLPTLEECRMNRTMAALGAMGLASLAASGAMAGNYHAGVDLICSECHTAHASQSHSNGDTRGEPYDNMPIVGGPHENLLRFGLDAPAAAQDGFRTAAGINALCLTCHDNSAMAPDIIGANTGKYAGQLRQAGSLNLAGSAQENHGHSLGWQGPIPGSDGTTAPTTLAGTVGLACTNCHESHGSDQKYRNLLSGPTPLSNGAQIDFTGKAVTFEVKDPLTTATNTKAVVVRAFKDYNQLDVEFEEENQTESPYAEWCKTCHNNFHGSGGDPNMGSISGGAVQAGGQPWLRHPTADVNIGGATTDSLTFVSSLSLYMFHAAQGPGHAAKVMDAEHHWTGGGRVLDQMISPSCFSCHKAHGNNNPFGLIFMGGNSTISEDGDGGSFRGMCHQCHSQGRDPAQPM
jgi:hypothetical protein